MLVLTPDLLLCAYASGLFPDGQRPARSDDPLDRAQAARHPAARCASTSRSSLRKLIRRQPFEIRVDQAFERVILACAEPRPERPRTWLNDDLIELYCALHRQGYAHSVESWAGGHLVGGLYGVSLGAAFFGESMFSRVRATPARWRWSGWSSACRRAATCCSTPSS